MLAIDNEADADVHAARPAQATWARVPVRERLRVVRRIRNEIATSADALLDAFPIGHRSSRAERLAAELLPLAEACRFLEHEAEAILATRKLRARKRPFWLRGISIEEHRDPLGLVLIIGPANYPLFLPAVQALQAIVAGNAVAVKPGRGGYRVMKAFEQIAQRAGLPKGTLSVLDEDINAAKSLISRGVDKIVVTGSAETGRAVYRQAADRVTPLILELSGCDPVFVQSGADLERTVKAIAFGLSWNGGDTCIAPRRIFVASPVANSFKDLLRTTLPSRDIPPIITFDTEEQALDSAAETQHALGASVFGPSETASAFAARVPAGIVVVNDMIMPTADPRAAFGGRKQSGFGATRGAEGLREFTALKVILVQHRRRLRHLEPLPADAEQLFVAYLSASCATRFGERLRSSLRLLRILTKGRRR